MKRLGCTVAALSAFVSHGAAAATVQYAGSADGTDYLLTFDDSTAGQIDVSIDATADPNSTDILGLAFDFDFNPAFVESDFVFVASNTGEGITDVCFDTLTCGGGLNFNGTDVLSFDYIVRTGDQGMANGGIMSFDFYITTDATLAGLGDSFGIRAQSTGDDGEGSIKLVDFTIVPQVPVPAAGFMLLAGLGGLAAVRRRKSAA